MAIIFNCPSCGKHFEVGDGLAGRRVRCKVCANEMRIPGEPRSSSQPDQSTQLLSSSKPKPRSESSPRSQAKPSGRSLPRTDPAPEPADVFGFDETPLPPRGSSLPTQVAQVAAEDDPEFASPWRAPARMDSRPSKPGKHALDEVGPLPFWLAILVGMLAIPAGIIVLMLIVGGLSDGRMGSVMMGLLCIPAFALLGVAIVNNLKIMCHAARIGLVHLLAYLLVPFYSLIFVAMHWRATKRCFLLQILGAVGFYGLLFLGIAVTGGFQDSQ